MRVPSHLTRIRVRYAETDQMGVVYYANYLVWMEVARVEYCSAIGFRYKDMEMEDGVLLAVVEAQCRYHSPARFDEEVLRRNAHCFGQLADGEFHLPDAAGRG